MYIDDEGEDRREEAPDREKCLRIEHMCHEKPQKHGASEYTDLRDTQEHRTATSRDEVQGEAQCWEWYREVIEYTFSDHPRRYRSHDDTSEEIESDRESYHRDSCEEFLTNSLLLDEPYREWHVHRPEHIGK